MFQTFTPSFAQTIENPNPRKRDYKMSMDEFRIKYGKDDRSRQLINFFAKKRMEATYLVVFPSVISTALSIVGDPTRIILYQDNIPPVTSEVSFSPLGLGLSIPVWAGLAQFSRFSRKRLYLYLQGDDSIMAPPVKQKWDQYLEIKEHDGLQKG
jgi:hypothetical protein